MCGWWLHQESLHTSRIHPHSYPQKANGIQVWERALYKKLIKSGMDLCISGVASTRKGIMGAIFDLDDQNWFVLVISNNELNLEVNSISFVENSRLLRRNKELIGVVRCIETSIEYGIVRAIEPAFQVAVLHHFDLEQSYHMLGPLLESQERHFWLFSVG